MSAQPITEGKLQVTSSDATPDASSPSAPSYGKSDHYGGESGRTYQELRSSWPLSAMAVIHAEKFNPAINERDTVVDFGCGSGEILAAIYCGRRIGVEINTLAQEQAKHRGIEIFENTSLIPNDIADVVISHHALEHVPYPVQALRELKRILKPSGELVICVPVEHPRRSMSYDPTDVANHLHTWTVQLLGNTLREAGFAVDRSSVRIISRRVPRQLVELYPLMPKPLATVIARVFAAVRRHKELVAHVRPTSE